MGDLRKCQPLARSNNFLIQCQRCMVWMLLGSQPFQAWSQGPPTWRPVAPTYWTKPCSIVPLAFDQPHWAQRITELGAGESLSRENLTVPKLAQALRRLLAPAAAQRALRLQASAVNGVPSALHPWH